VRTTLNIADDVLFAAKERAKRERRSVGDVLSDLARRALHQPSGQLSEAPGFLGFEPLPSRGVVVTNELIDKLREDELD
jgi:hypothetical protein